MVMRMLGKLMDMHTTAWHALGMGGLRLRGMDMDMHTTAWHALGMGVLATGKRPQIRFGGGGR